MSQFTRYHHVVKLGHVEVSDILEDTVTIYPKLDGASASVWLDTTGEVQAGSRNRMLTLENDNASFLLWVREQKGLRAFLLCHPTLILYGEWLVPHSLKTYRETAWRRFWVFDVFDTHDNELYPAEAWEHDFEFQSIDFITPLAKISHPTEEQLQGLLTKTNTFLIEDGAGVGEGLVIKRYGTWRNQFGKQQWAKMVRNEFVEMNKKAFGTRETSGAKQTEVEIIEHFVTASLVQKELAKIVHELAPTTDIHDSTELLEFYNCVMMANRGQIIPRLLQTVFYALIQEEMWAILKKHKNPVINFGKLYRLSVVKTKVYAPELF